MTGWRIGYLATKSGIINLINKIHQHMNTNVPTFSQKAALTAIKMEKKHIKKYNLQLKRNNDFIKKYLKNKSKLLTLVPSEGGLFTLMNIKKTGYKSDEFCNELLKKYNVAAIPGFYFGKNWDYHVRISLIENNKRFKQGVEKILKFEKNI